MLEKLWSSRREPAPRSNSTLLFVTERVLDDVKQIRLTEIAEAKLEHMADDTVYAPRRKGRSASICAASSMEAISTVNGNSQLTPDGGTPTGRRRRPATRSQSARVAGGRSIRRRAAVAAAANSSEVKSHYNSEPKLAETPDVSPGIRRKGSTRRGTSVYQRKSTAFLEIPDQRCAYGGGRSENEGEEDEDSYRLRSFSFTSKGKFF